MPPSLPSPGSADETPGGQTTRPQQQSNLDLANSTRLAIQKTNHAKARFRERCDSAEKSCTDPETAVLDESEFTTIKSVLRADYEDELSQIAQELSEAISAALARGSRKEDMEVLSARAYLGQVYLHCKEFAKAEREYSGAFMVWKEIPRAHGGGVLDGELKCRSGLARAWMGAAATMPDPQSTRRRALRLVMRNLKERPSRGDVRLCDSLVMTIIQDTYGDGDATTIDDPAGATYWSHVDALQKTADCLDTNVPGAEAMLILLMLQVKTRMVQLLAVNLKAWGRAREVHEGMSELREHPSLRLETIEEERMRDAVKFTLTDLEYWDRNLSLEMYDYLRQQRANQMWLTIMTVIRALFQHLKKKSLGAGNKTDTKEKLGAGQTSYLGEKPSGGRAPSLLESLTNTRGTLGADQIPYSPREKSSGGGAPGLFEILGSQTTMQPIAMFNEKNQRLPTMLRSLRTHNPRKKSHVSKMLRSLKICNAGKTLDPKTTLGCDGLEPKLDAVPEFIGSLSRDTGLTALSDEGDENGGCCENNTRSGALFDSSHTGHSSGNTGHSRLSSEWMSRMKSFSRLTLKSTEASCLLGARVTVIDTGICADHPRISKVWQAKGGQVAGKPSRFRDFSEIKPGDNLETPSDHLDAPVDEDGHGTFIAWLLLSLVPGVQLSVARIGKTRKTIQDENPELLSYRVGKVSLKVIRQPHNSADAIEYAVDVWGSEIISISFGCQKSQVAKDALKKAVFKDVIVFAATGNSGNTKTPFPASEDGVFKVYSCTAFAKEDETTGTPSDSYNSFHTLGRDIESVWPSHLAENIGSNDGKQVHLKCKSSRNPRDTWTVMSGTSFATPIAAAMVAIIYQFYRAHETEINLRLKTTADKLTTISSVRHILKCMSTTSSGGINPIFYLHPPGPDTGSTFYFEPDDRRGTAGNSEDKRNVYGETYETFLIHRLAEAINGDYRR
ncbi:hypothetical protein VTJ49DRAFT_2460 [Mycothermus thermophilus]|uniref:Peptidase S8/S53 domain-containing protein n=1 Tax=Humicola insolens TaxID=85995 RepID=A0ABR3VBS3_HUMIN